MILSDNGGKFDMKKLHVTCGIVTYNNADIIEKCIGTLLEYTKGCSIRIYVYDNHSSDGTVELIQKKFKQVRIIAKKSNKGFGYGHNRILQSLPQADYHIVVNPDIMVDTDVVTQMAEYMEANKNIGILIPKVLNTDGTEQFLPKYQPNFKYVIMSKFKHWKHYRDIYTRKNDQIKEPVKCENISGSFFMIRRSLVEELHGFDERYFMYFEDADLARRANQKADLVYNPNVYVYHAWKRDNTGNIRGICIFLKSMLKYALKWKGF